MITCFHERFSQLLPEIFIFDPSASSISPHYAAGLLADFFKHCVDHNDSQGLLKCLQLLDAPFAYDDPTCAEAIETTTFISIIDAGAPYVQRLELGLRREKSRFERVQNLWNKRPPR
jgi:hypothetical protein